MRFIYLMEFVFLLHATGVLAESRNVPLPPWTSVDQLISRYLRYQSGGYSQVIVPTRIILNKSDLAFQVCSSHSGVIPEFRLVTATSEPEIVIPTQLREQTEGPALTPYCYRSQIHNVTYTEASSMRVQLKAVGDYVPFRALSVDFKYFDDFDRVPRHVQFATTKESATFGFVHLWRSDVSQIQPVPVFVCLVSADPLSAAELTSPDGTFKKSLSMKPLSYGCYDLGAQTFSRDGKWILKIGRSEQPASVFEIQVGDAN